MTRWMLSHLLAPISITLTTAGWAWAQPKATDTPADAARPSTGPAAAAEGAPDGSAPATPEAEAPGPGEAGAVAASSRAEAPTGETGEAASVPEEVNSTPAAAPAGGVEVEPQRAVAVPEPEPERLPGLDALGSHQRHWWATMGVRTSFVNDSGFDPFAYGDALVQFTVGGGRALVSRRSLSLGVGVLYDVGKRSADARGDATSLLMQRVVLAPRIRNHLWARMFVFARPAVGLLRTRARLDESASGATLEAHNWGAAFDLTAGAEYQAYGQASGEDPSPRLWFGAEGGYGWAQKVHLEMSPDDSAGGPERVAPLDLGDLTLRGPTFRITATLSY